MTGDPLGRLDPQVRSVVQARVRVRFALGLDAFVERLLAVVSAAPEAAAAEVGRLSLDDLYLATACAAGDERAWEEVGARHFGFLRQFAGRILPAAAASDVGDQLIADLWQRGKIGRFEGRSALRTWLGVVVTRAALNALKAAHPTVPLDAPESRTMVSRLASPPQPHRDERSRLLATLVAAALAALPAEDRLMLLRHYEQGLTLDQIGMLHGRSKAALSRRLARIRADVLRRVDDLAHQRHGTSARELWAGLDPSAIEMDLAGAIAGGAATKPAAGCAVQEV